MRARPGRLWRSTCVIGVCVAVFGVWAGRTSKTVSSHDFSWQGTAEAYPHLKFLREFSSAEDVSRELFPVLNRTLDIVAGPPEARPSSDRLAGPYAVTTDSAHRVYVTDPPAGIVHIFDFERGKHSVLGGEWRHIRAPSGVAVASDGTIYVTDTAVPAIAVFDAHGKFLHYLGKSGGEAYFQWPTGIAIHEATGNIYVCDTRSHMVVELDKKGHILAHAGKRWGGKGPAEFRYPSQIAVAGEDVLVLDRANNRLQVLDLGGHFRREIKLPEVSTDAGLALDEEKHIYVSDSQLGTIHVFSYDGRLLERIGKSGTQAGELATPSGLWVEAGRGLFVVDTNNKKVQVFEIEQRAGE